MNEFSALDPDYLDDESQKNIEDYLCCICQLVPNYHKALEEVNCGHIFCSDCILNWKEKSNKCPFCKEDISTRSVEKENKLVYRFLINLIVKCQEEKCEWKGQWNELNQHIKKEHKNNEDNINEDIIFVINNFYNSKLHNHQLKYLGDTSFKWKCDGDKFDICKSGKNNDNQNEKIGQFNCKECNFNLCIKCMRASYDSNNDYPPIEEINNKHNDYINDNINYNKNIRNNKDIYWSKAEGIYELNRFYLSKKHKHLLKYEGITNSDWVCDGKTLEAKCFSGITDFGQTCNTPRFHCKKCDFDLCLKCMNNYLIKPRNYIINNEYNYPNHKHPLIYKGTNDDIWYCNGNGIFNKCLTDESLEVKDHKNIPRFRCEQCDFDLCVYCFDFYSNINDGCCIF